jgi:hypothetical protein
VRFRAKKESGRFFRLSFCRSELVVIRVHGSPAADFVSDKPELRRDAVDNHTFTITKTNCTYTKPFEIGGTQSKTHLITLFTESAGGRTQRRAAGILIMANGDKAFYSSEGTGDVAAQTSEGHWAIDGGTGKCEGAKGKGTYKGRVGAGGLRTYDSEGEIELMK